MLFLKDLPEVYQIMFWVMGILIMLFFGITAFFLRRFILSHDKYRDSIQKQLNSHDERIARLADGIQESASRLSSDANEMQKTTFKYQKMVSDELTRVKNDALEAQRKINETSVHVTNLSKQIEHMTGYVDRMYQSIQENSKNIQSLQEQVGNHASHLSHLDKKVKEIGKKVDR